MRNSPIGALDKVPMLIGGQLYSNMLLWFRGPRHQPMEKESQFLVDEVLAQAKTFQSLISIDMHSGFRFKDQIWFPLAIRKKPSPRLDLIQVMTDNFKAIYPDHIYKIEPQSKVYCTDSDIWDYLLHDQIKNSNFLPLTLEKGSWFWVRKNPLQIFNLEGLFNPFIKQCIKRIFRPHQSCIDFLTRFLVYMRTDK